MTPHGGSASAARALREEFDRTFARPAQASANEAESFLTMRIGGDAYAIRLSDIAGVAADQTIVPIPTSQPGLLGLVGIRGGIVPVFGLAELLGYDRHADAARWMVLCGADDLIALAFAEFEGHRRVHASDVHTDDRPRNEYLREVVNADAGVRAVIGVPLIAAAIRNRSVTTSPQRSNET